MSNVERLCGSMSLSFSIRALPAARAIRCNLCCRIFHPCASREMLIRQQRISATITNANQPRYTVNFSLLPIAFQTTTRQFVTFFDLVSYLTKAVSEKLKLIYL